MIIDKVIKIRVNNKDRKYYSELGYFIPKERNSLIEVSVTDLPTVSGVFINVMCDVCNKTKDLKYSAYVKNINNGGFYSCKGRCAQSKFIKTCNDKYGVNNVFQSDAIKYKIYETNLEKYGVKIATQNKDISNKAFNTNIKNNNGFHYFQTSKRKEDVYNKYGVDNVFQLDEIKEKIKKTNLEKYGFEYSSQNYEIHKKQQTGSKAIKFNDSIYYRSSYEQDFLEKFSDKIKINNSKAIKYNFNGKECIYFPDFYIDNMNLIIEIKSSYYYYDNKFYNKNLEKEKQCIKEGYNYIVIIDKKYDELLKLINGK